MMAAPQTIIVRDGERGAILVAVLWIVAVTTLLVVSLGRDVRSNADLARLEIDRLKTQVLLESAVEIAAAKLISVPKDAPDTWDGRAANFSIGGSVVELHILDASGLLDIARAEPDLLRSFVDKIAGTRANGVALVDAILERRTESEKHPADKLPFQSVDEIYELASGDSELAETLMPFIGLYSKDGRINARAAPREVIESVPDISATDVEQILSLRRGGRPDIAALKRIVAPYEKYLSAEPGDIFIVEAQIVSGAHLIAGSSVRTAIALDRKSAEKPYYVVSWSW
jgi:general secretion pathway protein K